MRELTIDETESVSGAGFWGNFWGGFTAALTATGDFLGFDGHFGYQGGGGGSLSFGNFGAAIGNLFGGDSVGYIIIDGVGGPPQEGSEQGSPESSLLCPSGHVCVPFGPEGGPALRDVSDGAIYYTPEWVNRTGNVQFDYGGIAIDLGIIATGAITGAGSGLRAALGIVSGGSLAALDAGHDNTANQE